ncbi:uncharacterized protein [Typha angustifolia]|uniref:uncharacterized protein isoform X3 n=1 Tax=Typha angustifolia TaxID=59011 RepID=UPI003C2D131D
MFNLNKKLPDKNRGVAELLGEELETFHPIGGQSLIDSQGNSVRQIPQEFSDDNKVELEFQLSQNVINLEALQHLACRGLLEGREHRATIWKAVRNLDNREETSSPRKQCGKSYNDELLSRIEIINGDHPLSISSNSIWNQFFKDVEIVEQIDRDLPRTHPDIEFFSADSPLSQKHLEAMRNILLLFAKLNPAIGYVQGMNELLAPLFYVFRTDPDEKNGSYAEADSFACFVRLLSHSMDHFCQQLDYSSTGIHSTLSRLSQLLKANDIDLWQHLDNLKVNPQFYAFRWITLLLTQEFKFHYIMGIWDCLLSNHLGVQDMLLRVCCAMLVCVKKELLVGDFASNLKLLQHYPEIDLKYLLHVAHQLTPSCSDSLGCFQNNKGIVKLFK